MIITRNLVIAFCLLFTAFIVLAILMTAEFDTSNIRGDIYAFIRDFLDQWSWSFVAIGTLLLAVGAFGSISESRRTREREDELAIHALHDAIHSNITDIILLRYRFSEEAKLLQTLYERTGRIRVDMVKERIDTVDTTIFENMRARGQLHLLGDLRMPVVASYKLIDMFNKKEKEEDRVSGSQLGLLKYLHQELQDLNADLEEKFRFLPRHMRDTGVEPVTGKPVETKEYESVNSQEEQGSR